MSKDLEISSKEIVEKIYLIRGHKVMLDNDLANMYCVETGQLKRQVRRNIDRFPEDFMFVLTQAEFNDLRSQFGISSWGGARYLPMAFTEQGVAMLSSVLGSKQAIAVNIQIMRIFTRIREMLVANKDILIKLEAIENKLLHHDHHLEKHEKAIQVIFEALKQLLDPPQTPRKKIGYRSKNDTE